jgi:hypothetical protein
VETLRRIEEAQKKSELALAEAKAAKQAERQAQKAAEEAERLTKRGIKKSRVASTRPT